MTQPDNTARNAEIVRLRKAGLWPTQIARQLGLTRNAVIGVLFRAGLSDPDHNPIASALRGAHHPRAKLTEAQIDDIRRRLKRGELQRVIAYRFGVSQHAISDIARGKTWSHVTARQPGGDPGAAPERAGEHVVSHTIAPTGADCRASGLNEIEDTAGASGVRAAGGAA